MARIAAAPAITQVCKELKYSRSHVANVLRKNRKRLKAKFIGSRWYLDDQCLEELRGLVKNQSGRRYKLGETGKHGK